jgi:hypothetical protein
MRTTTRVHFDPAKGGEPTKTAEVTVYIDDSGRYHLDQEDAKQANKILALRALDDFLCSLNVYGVGSGMGDYMIDSNDLADKMIGRRDELKSLLDAASGEGRKNHDGSPSPGEG